MNLLSLRRVYGLAIALLLGLHVALRASQPTPSTVPTGRVVTLCVTDKTGKAVATAGVRINRCSTSGEGYLERITDVNGRCSFDAEIGGNYLIDVAPFKEGLAPYAAPLKFYICGDQAAGSQPDLTLQAEECATVLGQVVNAQTGAPLPGAFLRVLGPGSADGVTTPDGRFVIAVPPVAGPVAVQVLGGGCYQVGEARGALTGAVGQRLELPVRALPIGKLKITLVDEAGATVPFSGLVSVMKPPGGQSGMMENGECSMPDVPPADYTVACLGLQAMGLELADDGRFTRTPGEADQAVRLRVTRLVKLRVVVVDAEAGAPLEGVMVTATDAKCVVSFGPAKTGKDGTVDLLVSNRQLSVTAGLPGRRLGTATWEGAGSPTVRITVKGDDQPDLRIRLLSGGRPVPAMPGSVCVIHPGFWGVSGVQADANRPGEFFLQNLATGPFILRALTPGYAPQAIAVRWRDGNPKSVDIPLDAGVPVSLTIAADRTTLDRVAATLPPRQTPPGEVHAPTTGPAASMPAREPEPLRGPDLHMWLIGTPCRIPIWAIPAGTALRLQLAPGGYSVICVAGDRAFEVGRFSASRGDASFVLPLPERPDWKPMSDIGREMWILGDGPASRPAR